MTQGKSDPFPENTDKKRKKDIDPDLEGLTNVDRRVSDKEFAAVRDNQVLCGELKEIFDDMMLLGLERSEETTRTKRNIKKKFKDRLKEELENNNLI